MEPIFELHNDTEIRTSAADTPEQVNVFAGVLVADPYRPLVRTPHPIGHDQYFALRQRLVHPAIEDRFDRDICAEFLGDFTREAGRGILAGLEPAAGQFLFAPLVFEQNDPALLEQHAFDRAGNNLTRFEAASGFSGFHRKYHRWRGG